jgi:hypothetical protein
MSAMTREQDQTVTYRGARFEGADFTGATFRDCDLRKVKIVDAWLVDVNFSGLIGNFVVNDVDVTAFVEAELDRRHPNVCRSARCKRPTTTARCGTPSNTSGPTQWPGRDDCPRTPDRSESMMSGRSSRRCAER